MLNVELHLFIYFLSYVQRRIFYIRVLGEYEEYKQNEHKTKPRTTAHVYGYILFVIF